MHKYFQSFIPGGISEQIERKYRYLTKKVGRILGEIDEKEKDGKTQDLRSCRIVGS